mmetsp:Transcript_18725/g.23346  ORF Transcript_18725/g.23346 Transcript_18725/m.23346 type:complete len:137 (+) Transcript_18725:247-657(+)|eukprot:CAMPEP_0170463082 /NCGR_PEP_ID=MMETSP0123-20130129/8331_1 /TAXON_ID=182087 /ORGANISM="Favella ehrenbergii, Strain Fehren 1" /LENGTH=136 /DNA_ID=CAMNT_0010728433 /DNA_START=403 /DNA_END=813 /DNA_ORIENTATION=+
MAELNQAPYQLHTIKVETPLCMHQTAQQMAKDSAMEQWDARLAQMRVESYNKEVRERHLRNFKKRQEKQEYMKRLRADHKASIDKDQVSQANGSDSENDDVFEAMKMKKVNQKFSKLMSFNLDNSFNTIKNLTGKH